MAAIRLTLLGVGAMNSPRYAPAGLLVESSSSRLMIDGGDAAEPSGALDAWLVTDTRCELMPDIRRRARARGLEPVAASFLRPDLTVVPKPVVHTSHHCCGYLIEASGRRAGWAPEFLEFPAWAARLDLLFAEAAGWQRPIRFAHGTGGHAAALDVARAAQESGVRRLVFAHIGRPTLRAIDLGLVPPFGDMGHDGDTYELA